MRLFLALCLVSFSALAANWSDLDEGKTYKLSKSFQLPQSERSGSMLDFSKGESLTLREIMPLGIPGVELTLFIFNYNNCPGTAMTTEMEIVPVEGSTPLVEVGAKVESCEVNLYIETKDFYNKSVFE